MKLRVWWLVVCAVLYVHGSEREDKDQASPIVYGTLGYGLELILKKFDIVSSKLKTIEDKIQTMEDKFKSMNDKVRSVEEKLQNTESMLQEIKNDSQDHRSSQEKSQKEMFAAIQNLEGDVDSVHNITRQIMNVLPHLHAKPPPYSSCKDVPITVSGIYPIRVTNDSEPFEVYCEQQKFGGGWTVFQYRYDGSLDFYRGWDEFRDGFGDLNKEFWLGLEKLHQITRGRKHEWIVELIDFSGNYGYAQYDAFEIGSESEQYNLKELGKYNGTAGNAFYIRIIGRVFSTKDRDNDVYQSNCAQYHEGAWWHYGCTSANLNGRYMKAIDRRSMFWGGFKMGEGMSYTRMMIRELE